MLTNDTRLERCAVCAKTFWRARHGRPRRYCGAACKQHAYRLRLDGLHGANCSHGRVCSY